VSADREGQPDPLPENAKNSQEAALSGRKKGVQKP
jgi:hypothetical protein